MVGYFCATSWFCIGSLQNLPRVSCSTVQLSRSRDMSDRAPRAPTTASVHTNTISDERCATLRTSDPSTVDAFLASGARHAYARVDVTLVGAGADLRQPLQAAMVDVGVISRVDEELRSEIREAQAAMARWVTEQKHCAGGGGPSRPSPG